MKPLTTTVSYQDLVSWQLNLINQLSAQTLDYLQLIFAVVVFLVTILSGLFYFFTLKPFEKELEQQASNIKEAKEFLSGSIISETKVLKEEMDRSIEENNIKTEATLEASKKKILEEVNTLNQKEFTSIKNDILNTVKNEILVSQSETLDKINTLDKTKTLDINSYKTKIDSIKTKLDEIAITVKELETDKYAAKGLQGHIMGLIDLLELERTSKAYKIPERLVEIRDYLKENPIRSYIAIDLNKTLTKLEEKQEWKSLIEEVKKSIHVVAD